MIFQDENDCIILSGSIQQSTASNTRHSYKGTIVALTGVLIITGFIALRFSAWPVYVSLAREDSVLEYAQAVTFLSAGVLAILILPIVRSIRSRFHFFAYLIFTLAMFFIAGEEICWGQKLIGFQTPEFIIKDNCQGEATLHNLIPSLSVVWRLYVVVGLCGAFGGLFSRRLPLRFRDNISSLMPEWFLLPYFLPVALVYLAFAVLGKINKYFPEARNFRIGVLVSRWDQEPAEMLLAIGFLLLMICRYRAFRNAKLMPAETKQ